jgi:hypothetical protein
MDNWQSSPTCSVGNTSKSDWNTPLVHYCIDDWELILFQLNQTIHAMYKAYQAEIVLTAIRGRSVRMRPRWTLPLFSYPGLREFLQLEQF